MKKIYILLFIVLGNLQLFGGSDEQKLFSMFPIPLHVSKLTIKLNNFNSGIARIELRNLIGKKLIDKPFPAGSDEVYFEEMDSYPNGVYVVIAKDGNGKILETSKLIINK